MTRVAQWGEFLATRARARQIREHAETQSPTGDVVLDFVGVEAVGWGAADELVASLAASGRRVVVTGANEDVADTVRVVLGRRPISGEVEVR